eukprot:Hpha_TRINITY_DN3195_c0_g1::TRINITY_DN3195_c0_g1_i1::g.96640::m.96640
MQGAAEDESACLRAVQDAVPPVPSADPSDRRWWLHLCRLAVKASPSVSGAIARARRTQLWRNELTREGGGEPCVHVPKATAHHRHLVYVPLRGLCSLQRLQAQLASFFFAVESAGRALGEDAPLDGVVVVFNAGGVRQLPTAFLQHASILSSAHYPALIHKVVVYPIPVWAEAELRAALPSVDIGSAASWCAAGPLSVGLECTNARTSLEKMLDIGGELAWGDLPQELVNTPPVPTDRAPRRPADGKTDAGRAVTPWQPTGVAAGTVELGDEVTDLAGLVLLTPRERKGRLGVRSGVQAAAERVLGRGAVTVKRVEAHQVTIHSDPVELIIENLPEEAAPGMLQAMELVGFESVVAIPEGLTARTDEGVSLVLRLRGRIEVPRRQRAELLRGWLLEYAPGATAAYAVLRHIIVEAGCGDPLRGGLSRDALLLMIVHLCRRVAQRRRRRGPPPLLAEDASGEALSGGTSVPLEAGEVFHDFLVYFQKFDTAKHSIDAWSSEAQPKRHPSDQLSVCDPLDLSINTAAALTRLPALQAHFRYCAHGLRVAKGKARSANAGQKKTPLSGIVAEEPLWRRRRHLVAGMELHAAAAAPADPKHEIVTMLTGDWVDERGGLWRIRGNTAENAGVTYLLALNAWQRVQLLCCELDTVTQDELQWTDGDLWRRLGPETAPAA